MLALPAGPSGGVEMCNGLLLPLPHLLLLALLRRTNHPAMSACRYAVLFFSTHCSNQAYHGWSGTAVQWGAGMEGLRALTAATARTSRTLAPHGTVAVLIGRSFPHPPLPFCTLCVAPPPEKPPSVTARARTQTRRFGLHRARRALRLRMRERACHGSVVWRPGWRQGWRSRTTAAATCMLVMLQLLVPAAGQAEAQVGRCVSACSQLGCTGHQPRAPPPHLHAGQVSRRALRVHN